MGSNSSSTLWMLLCVEISFSDRVVPLSPSTRHFPISFFVSQSPYDSRRSFVCLDSASSSCFVFFAIISLRAGFAFRWSGLWVSKASQSFSNPHILQARLEELANAYTNSFFLILSCKVMNIVLNNIHIGSFINSIASLCGLYGNFGMSLERYAINLLIKLTKYFMISSASKPKPFRVLNKYWHVLRIGYGMLLCPVKSSRVSKSIINVFF